MYTELAEQLTSCPSDFITITGVGCFKISTDSRSFCSARKECRQLGADIASFKTVDHFTTFRNYMMGAECE